MNSTPCNETWTFAGRFLLAVEAAAPPPQLPGAGYYERIDVNGYSQEQIQYHIWLLAGAGLVDAFSGLHLAVANATFAQ